MPKPSQKMKNKTHKAIINGIEQAQKVYCQMSDKSMVEGPEYWITTFVARKLWNSFRPVHVILEKDSDAARKAAGATPRRTANKAKGKRYDIVMEYKHGQPRLVVEIKKIEYKQTNLLMNDLERVKAAISSANIGLGAIGYYYFENPKTKSAMAEIRHYHDEDFLSEVRAFAKKYDLSMSDDRGSLHAAHRTGGAWVAGSILVERKRII